MRFASSLKVSTLRQLARPMRDGKARKAADSLNGGRYASLGKIDYSPRLQIIRQLNPSFEQDCLPTWEITSRRCIVARDDRHPSENVARFLEQNFCIA
jgi:hypothetical protein